MPYFGHFKAKAASNFGECNLEHLWRGLGNLSAYRTAPSVGQQHLLVELQAADVASLVYGEIDAFKILRATSITRGQQ